MKLDASIREMNVLGVLRHRIHLDFKGGTGILESEPCALNRQDGSEHGPICQARLMLLVLKKRILRGLNIHHH